MSESALTEALKPRGNLGWRAFRNTAAPVAGRILIALARLAIAAMIVRLWGVMAYLACLWAAIARRPSTFLGTLYPAPVAPSRPGPDHPMLGGSPCASPRRPTR